VLRKMDGRNVLRGNCPGKTSGGNNYVQGECSTSVTNLCRGDKVKPKRPLRLVNLI